MKKISLVLLLIFAVYFSGYALTKEEIFNEKEKILSLYYLSNNNIEIEKEIFDNNYIYISLSKVGWQLNDNISENVKNVMNKLNLNYAMTTYSYYGIFNTIIVYRRLEDEWFSFIYPIPMIGFDLL